MLDDLLKQFMNSTQGAQALTALQQQHGLNPDTAQQAVGAASYGAMNALGPEATAAGGSNPLEGLTKMLGGSAGGNALTGAISGMLQGQGMRGAIEGGIGGVIAGKVAQEIAKRTGMNPQMAATAAAAVTPFLLNFLRQRTGAPDADQPGASPAQPQAAESTWGEVPKGEKGGMAPNAKTVVNPAQPAQGSPAPAREENEPGWKKIL